MTPQALVERLYNRLWNEAREEAADEILAPDFDIRGALVMTKRRPEGGLRFSRSIHTAFGGLQFLIEDLVVGGSRVAARMRFEGTHRGPLLGVPPSGRHVSWAGAAFFDIPGPQISRLWVLGDIDVLKRELAGSD